MFKLHKFVVNYAEFSTLVYILMNRSVAPLAYVSMVTESHEEHCTRILADDLGARR